MLKKVKVGFIKYVYFFGKIKYADLNFKKEYFLID